MSQKKEISHDFFIMTVHESTINSWLFFSPLEQSDHVPLEDALEDRCGEVNIVAVDIVKEVLQSSIDLQQRCR